MGKRSRLGKIRRLDRTTAPERPLQAAEPTPGGPPQDASLEAYRARLERRHNPPDPIEALRRRYWLDREQADRTARVVASARRAGISWARIGETHGITAEGARKRWGP